MYSYFRLTVGFGQKKVKFSNPGCPRRMFLQFHFFRREKPDPHFKCFIVIFQIRGYHQLKIFRVTRMTFGIEALLSSVLFAPG